MAIRSIEYLVDIDGISPETLTWGGVQNEHNATVVKYVLSDKLLAKIGENACFRIDFMSDVAGYDPSENLNYENLERAIPQKFTAYAGKMTATLVIFKLNEDEEFISIPSEIFFTRSKRDDGKKIIENLSAYEQYILSLIESIDEKIKNLSIDEAVKNALTNPQCLWSDEDKQKARQLLKAKEDKIVIVDNARIDYYNDYSATVTTNLIEGEKYTWSYYCSEYPGWFVAGAEACPTQNRKNIESIATVIEVEGKNYLGFSVSCFSWAGGQPDGNVLKIYQDGNKIKVYKNFGGDNDTLTIEK